MTLAGTNTYLVGAAPTWVIDPGPADEHHLAAIADAAESRGGIAGILLTHSHADHSEAVNAIDAPLLWGTPNPTLESHWAAPGGGDDPAGAEASPTDASPAGGMGIQRSGESPEPDRDPHDRTRGPSAGSLDTDTIGPFTAIPTPGHAKDHVCFEWERVLFCGDLILGEGSTIVPPSSFGGSLRDYMASLERVAALGAELLAPGHGPWITDPAAKVEEYLAHRREREGKLLGAIEAGERSRDRLLEAAWDDVPALLRPAAALAMEAHLEKLAEEGRVPAELAS